MKIALLLFGQGRHVQECYESVNLNILQNYDCDVFSQVWWDKDIIKDGYYGFRKKYEIDDNLLEIIQDLYKPKKFLIESPEIHRVGNHYKFSKNEDEKLSHLNQYADNHEKYLSISQIIGFQNVSQLFDWSDYDFVIKWRYDIRVMNFPELNNLNPKIFYPAYSQYPTFIDDPDKFSDAAFLMPNDFFYFSRIYQNVKNKKFSPKRLLGEDLYNGFLEYLGLTNRMIKLSWNDFQVELL